MPKNEPPSPPRRFPILQILLVITAGLLVWFLLFYAQPEQLPYSVFLELVEEGHVHSAEISRTLISGRFDREASKELLSTARARQKALTSGKSERLLGLSPDELMQQLAEAGMPEVEVPRALELIRLQEELLRAPEEEQKAKLEELLGEVRSTGELASLEPEEGEENEEGVDPGRAFTPPLAGVSEESYPYITLRGEFFDDISTLKELLEANDVLYTVEPESDFLTYVLPVILLIGLMVVLWIFLMRRTDAYGQQVLSFGKTKARVVAVNDTETTFEDVAGCEEAKEELSEVIAFLRDPARFQKLGGTVPKGVLLIGSPGTGKTLMARAIAGEAGVPFFSLSGSDFVEMFVGVGAARVRDLFAQATSKAPCIVFIDEIDAVGRQRGVGLGGGNDEREQTLNQLLSEMDGFEPNAGVIVLAATNRPDVLDQALLRPGRFDRQVVIDNADVAGREQILEVHARGKPLADDVDLAEIAKQTPGFSGADLANVMNEAALLAARREKEIIARAEVLEAVERVMAGPERRSRVIRPNEKKVIATHETGHALVSFFCDRADRVQKISIVPRGHGALGYTLQIPAEDRYILQRAELVDRMCVLLGGRIAEELVFGDSSTGAADDLEKVSDLARSMVCRWGMSENVGPLIFQKSEPSPFLGHDVEDRSGYSDATLERLDAEVKELVLAAYDRARDILSENRDLLDSLADRLIEREVMEGHEFAAAIRESRGDAAPKHARDYPTAEELAEERTRARQEQKLREEESVQRREQQLEERARRREEEAEGEAAEAGAAEGGAAEGEATEGEAIERAEPPAKD